MQDISGPHALLALTILALVTRPADRGDAYDEQASVALDKPVCILGRAAEAGSAEAIDKACAADDMQRVHAQLGGVGK